jgi:plasmid stability protein
MTTMQIRNVPEDLRRTLKSRAAAAGMPLSQYLLLELTRSVERPSIEELAERISRAGAVELPPADEVLADARAERDSRR